MIEITFSQPCHELMQEIGLAEDDVRQAVNHPHALLNDRRSALVHGVYWRDDSSAIFFVGAITGCDPDSADVTEARIDIAITIDGELPAGQLCHESDAETVLATVAESFGVPVRCHPDEPFSTLYSGPAVFDPNEPESCFVDILNPVGPFYSSGHAQPADGYASYVWIFGLDRYREWRASIR